MMWQFKRLCRTLSYEEWFEPDEPLGQSGTPSVIGSALSCKSETEKCLTHSDSERKWRRSGVIHHAHILSINWRKCALLNLTEFNASTALQLLPLTMTSSHLKWRIPVNVPHLSIRRTTTTNRRQRRRIWWMDWVTTRSPAASNDVTRALRQSQQCAVTRRSLIGRRVRRAGKVITRRRTSVYIHLSVFAEHWTHCWAYSRIT